MALLAPVDATETDQAIAERLMAERSTEQIALALVQAHRARLPEPEELLSSDAPASQGPRQRFEGSAWFRVNIGRSHNADPRWLLPLLCRRGHVSRSEIGAIRISANDSLFEVPGAVAARFLDAVARTASDDGVEIVAAEGPPPPAAPRRNRGPADRGNDRGAERSGPPRDKKFKHHKGRRKP